LNGNAPILVPSCARLRVSILLPLLFLLALVPGLTAQVPGPTAQVPNPPAQRPGPIFKAPDQVVERIITAQVLACQVADTASGAVLAGLDLALQRLIQEQEALVRETVKESAPGLLAEKTFAESEARLKPLEAELDPLLARRNEINSSQTIYEDSISTATQGDAPPGTKSRLEQLDDDMMEYDKVYIRDSLELKKITDNWLEGRDDQLRAAIAENRTNWTRARDERRGIMRRIHTARYNPQYQALVTEEEALDIRIAELQEKVKPLREARDAAKETLAAVNLENIKKLEQLHEINGFTHQYLSYARDCVERRRGQLAQAVPPPAAGQEDVLTGTASGRWGATCKYKGAEGYVEGRPLNMGGTVNFQFDGAGGVSGTFVANSSEFGVSSFPVVATLRADPDPLTGRRVWVENGMGAGTGWSGTWQGRFGTIDGQFTGHGFNAPILTIQTSKWGEAECVATWSVP
jgi:hypothetical protein